MTYLHRRIYQKFAEVSEERAVRNFSVCNVTFHSTIK